MLEIKIRPLSKKYVVPCKEEGSAYYDLAIPEAVEIDPCEVKVIPLGFACKLPEGYYARIVMRSSSGIRYGISLLNQTGIIDNSYSGNEDEWKLIIFRHKVKGKDKAITIPAGARIAQFEVVKQCENLEFKVVDNLEGPSRGGLGSTGL